jgi:acyl-CoA reductase-like NAD-dependent aldehyde dehydrogenase
VDKVAFTGSTEVGKEIVKAAAGNLKKVTLELGGKSPNVVYADADIDKAIVGSANAIFFNQGECCVAGSRLYVEESVYDQVVEGVAEQAHSIKIGNGLDPSTTMGPLVSREQFERVTGYLSSGRDDGATIIGGDQVGDRGYFVAPAILTGTREDMKAVREEIFGPVVAAAPFKTGSDITPTANNSNYGHGRRCVHPRHHEGHPYGEAAACRHGLGEHLERVRRGAAVRRLQRIRLGSRDGPRRAHQLHGNQDRHHRSELSSDGTGAGGRR